MEWGNDNSVSFGREGWVGLTHLWGAIRVNLGKSLHLYRKKDYLRVILRLKLIEELASCYKYNE